MTDDLKARSLVNGGNYQNRPLIDRWVDITQMQVRHAVDCIMVDAHQRVWEIMGGNGKYFMRHPSGVGDQR